MPFPLTIKRQMPCMHWNHFPISTTDPSIIGQTVFAKCEADMLDSNNQKIGKVQYFCYCSKCYSSKHVTRQ